MVWSRRLRFVATSAHAGGMQAGFVDAAASLPQAQMFDYDLGDR
jgi:hypothetical protein